MTTATATQIAAGTWSLDAIHSNIDFVVRHAGVSWLRGSFDVAEATLTVSDSGTLQIDGEVDATSVHTKSEQLTGHLASPDFFDTAQYPKLNFSSDEFTVNSDGTLSVPGKLTIKGHTETIELTGRVDASGTDAFGAERVGIELSATIDRTLFGVNWNAPLPTGGVMVANNVKLIAAIEFVQQ